MAFRTDVFLDALTLTVPIPGQQDRTALLRWFESEAPYERVNQYAEHRRPVSHLYQRSYWIDMGSGEECLVELRPRRAGNFLRLDFNPSKRSDSLRHVFNTLRLALPTLTVDSIMDARVTRVDMSFDLMGTSLELFDAYGLLRRRDTRRFKEITTADQFGRLNAIEIGAHDSPSRLTIYDKRVHQQLVRRSTYPRLLRSRIRFELRRRKWGLVREVPFAANQWANYFVYQHESELATLARGRNTAERMFLIAARHAGAQRVLSTLDNQRERDRFRSLLHVPPSPGFWNPQELWSEFQQAWARVLTL